METIPAKSEESVDAKIWRSDDPLAVPIAPQYLSRATSDSRKYFGLIPHLPGMRPRVRVSFSCSAG